MAETKSPSLVDSFSASNASTTRTSTVAVAPVSTDVEKKVPSFHQLFELLHDDTVALEEALKTLENWWQPTLEQAQMYQRSIQRKQQKNYLLQGSSNNPTPTRSSMVNLSRTSSETTTTKRQRTSLGGGTSSNNNSDNNTNDRNRMNRFGGGSGGGGSGIEMNSKLNRWWK